MIKKHWVTKILIAYRFIFGRYKKTVFTVFFLVFATNNLLSQMGDLPVIVHYGLNDSHSRNWAQINTNDIVGVTFFQKFENSFDEGTLIYKTIQPDGSENVESVATGRRLEKSVLLFDEFSNPNIFVASSTDSDQIIVQYYKNSSNQWQYDTIIHFYNEGGKFIYELSADTGSDGLFHLLILKTRSNIDSDDYNWAWLDSYLYHLTNASGNWQKQLIHNYDMAFTYDTYIKTSSRQDIKVDKDGYVHITFSEQINATDDPSRLWYATNKTGNWVKEIALNHDYGIRDDAGWFPSLCLDNNGIPYISCMYINRVYTYSAQYSKLFLLKRLGDQNWDFEIIAEHDDGYYGSDGRNYTGGLTHLVFDDNNTPHIIFSDIASTHYPYPLNQALSVGNIRYAVYQGGSWNIRTIYQQSLPTGFFNATEMYGMCLLISDEMDLIRVVGQELVITGENQYTCELINFTWDNNTGINDKNILQYRLNQNYPNPFNKTSLISYSINHANLVSLKVYDIFGREIQTLVNEFQEADTYSVYFNASRHSSEVYYCVLNVGNKFIEARKMVLTK